MNICDLSKNKCHHQDLLPLSFEVFVGFVILFFISAIANAGGIGGGGLVMPILLLVLKFYTNEAIPISKLMIFSGALTSFLLGFKVKHPFRNAISIDYNIPALLCPALLLGTMTGVSMNKVFPPVIIILSLSAVLILNTFKTLKRAISIHKKETKSESKHPDIEASAACHNNSKNDPEKNQNLVKSEMSLELVSQDKDYKQVSHDDHPARIESDSNKIGIDKQDNLTTIDYDQQKHRLNLLNIEVSKDLERFPLKKYLFFISTYASMLILTVIRGSDHFPSYFGIEPCSKAYWLTYFIYVPICIFLTYLVSLIISKEYAYRKSIGYPYNSYDIKWDAKLFFKFPLYAFFAGCLAGMLGIGGGLILAPLLLELGLHPVISSATSNFLVLFTSSSTSFQFIFLGMMKFDFSIACTTVSMIGSLFGTLLIQKLIERSGKYSYLIFTLGITLLISSFMILGEAISSFLTSLSSSHSIFKFNLPC